MVDSLMERGFLFLSQIYDIQNSNPLRQAWLSVEEMGFEEVDRILWERYTKSLHESHISLKDRKDNLLWSINVVGGNYVLGLDYRMIRKEDDLPNHEWWTKVIWKLQCPMKTKLLLWLALSRNIHLWDHLIIKKCMWPKQMSPFVKMTLKV